MSKKAARPKAKKATPKAKKATPKVKKASPHVRELDKLEAMLARTTEAEALGALAVKFHMVGYMLGHDIRAIINNPGLVGRATRGKLEAHERASAAHARAGNVRHALFHLFEGLDAFPDRADRERVAERIVAVLDVHAPLVGARLRSELAALPVIDDEMDSRQQFYGVVRGIKSAFDWDSLPRGRA